MNSYLISSSCLIQDSEYNSLLANKQRVKPIDTKTFQSQYIFSEEQLASPSSTQYNSEISEEMTPQQMSPIPEKGISRKLTEVSTTIDESEENTSENEMSQDEDENEEEVLAMFDEKKEAMLKKLATRYKYDWKKIANRFNKSNGLSLTPSVLRDKYKNLHKPNMALRVKFTHEEDLMIAKRFNQFGYDWAQIATYFPTRTAIMLKNRYYSYIRKNDLLSSMLSEDRDVQEDEETSVEEQIPVYSAEAEINCEENHKENNLESFDIPSRNRVMNLLEDYHDVLFNRQSFDMESCLSSGLSVRVASKNYYLY